MPADGLASFGARPSAGTVMKILCWCINLVYSDESITKTVSCKGIQVCNVPNWYYWYFCAMGWPHMTDILYHHLDENSSSIRLKNTANKIHLRQGLSITPSYIVEFYYLSLLFVSIADLIWYIYIYIYTITTFITITHLHCNMWDVITHPCFFCKQVPIWYHVGHGWIITPTLWGM